MSFAGLQEIARIASIQGKEFWQVIEENEALLLAESREAVFEKMRGMYRAMKDADAAYDPALRSPGRMSGGDGEKLRVFREKGDTLCGDFLSEVMEKAVKMGESNACMRRIVAAPTAGSCGVLPAVLLTYATEKAVPEDRIVKALFVAAGIGQILAQNASISGAEGGCQAEIGSASAMAAGAVAYLEGGDIPMILSATAFALKNMLGLVCDPVAGLVEVPCIKRNVAGAVNAITSAQMALAGVQSVIPVDEVIDSMYRIGKMMPGALRETGEGGLAATPTAIEIFARIRKSAEFSCADSESPATEMSPS